MGLFSKTRTKRIVPPERKFANAMLMREAINRSSGIESRGDQLQRQLRRSQALGDFANQRSGLFRTLGERGIEGPGAYSRASRAGAGGLASLIGAQTAFDIQKRQGAIPIYNTLLAENQPYTKTRKKTGFMEKAAPYLKLAGSVGGSYGDMSKQAGEDAEKDFQTKSGQFGGTGGAVPSGGGTSGGPPMSSVNPDKAPTGTSGGPPMSSVNTDSSLLKKKKNGGGLSNLMGMFSSMFGGGKGGGMSMPAGGK